MSKRASWGVKGREMQGRIIEDLLGGRKDQLSEQQCSRWLEHGLWCQTARLSIAALLPASCEIVNGLLHSLHFPHLYNGDNNTYPGAVVITFS